MIGDETAKKRELLARSISRALSRDAETSSSYYQYVCGVSALRRGASHRFFAVSRNKSRSSHKHGFTVVELLIVVTIFAIGSLSIAATYINFTRLHRKVANAETLGQDLRFVMELIVRAARNNTVVYPALPEQLTNPSNQLELASSVGSPMLFRKWGLAEIGGPCVPLNADCLALSLDYGNTWAPITGKNINVDRFNVYVTPLTNPFEAVGFTYDNNNQPRVTFVIDATYKTTNALEQAKLSIQTSVSSRLYVR